MVVLVTAIAPAPTIVFPAPQGSTTTPEPSCEERVDGSMLDSGRYASTSWASWNLVRGTRCVAGEVLGRPADLQQFLLDLAARPGVDDVGVGVRMTDEQRLDALVVRHLREHGRVGASAG